MQNPAYNLRRVASYLLGFVLFYEPFMLFNRLASTFFVDTSFSSIHVPCARIPLANIVTGDWQYASPISLFFCLLLAVSSLWFGPLFCGRLCPAGAFSEFLGSLLPDKYKIDWPTLVPILPLRYGFLSAFSFLSGSASACPASTVITIPWKFSSTCLSQGSCSIALRPSLPPSFWQTYSSAYSQKAAAAIVCCSALLVHIILSSTF